MKLKQGCCLTGARSPGAPKLYMRATKFLYKEPARAPINLRLSWDNGPYVPINLVLLADLQTVELFGVKPYMVEFFKNP